MENSKNTEQDLNPLPHDCGETTKPDERIGISEELTISAPTADNTPTLLNSDHVPQKSISEPLQSEKLIEGNDEKLSSLRKRKSTGDSPITTTRKRHTSKHSTPATSRRNSESKSTPDKDSPQQSEKRKLLPRRPGIEWKVGCRVEAMDFLKKWYPAKIIEVDEADADVLIHFDKWSSRFDEWLDMRSERLRAMSQSATPTATHKICIPSPQVVVGSMVLAKWSNCNKRQTIKYPAIVRSIISKKKINIEFYDGLEMQTDVSSVQNLQHDLQTMATDVWNMMKEIGEYELKQVEVQQSSEVKISRREQMESKKAHQAKIDAADALLSKLIEESSKTPAVPEKIDKNPKTGSAANAEKVEGKPGSQEKSHTPSNVRKSSAAQDKSDVKAGKEQPGKKQRTGRTSLKTEDEGTIEMEPPKQKTQDKLKKDRPSTSRRSAGEQIDMELKGAAYSLPDSATKAKGGNPSAVLTEQKSHKRCRTVDTSAGNSTKKKKLSETKRSGGKLIVAGFSRSKLAKKDKSHLIGHVTAHSPGSQSDSPIKTKVSRVAHSTAVIELSDVGIEQSAVKPEPTSAYSSDDDSDDNMVLSKLCKPKEERETELCVDVETTPTKPVEMLDTNLNSDGDFSDEKIDLKFNESFTPTTKRLLNSVAVVNLEKKDLSAVISSTATADAEDSVDTDVTSVPSLADDLHPSPPPSPSNTTKPISTMSPPNAPEHSTSSHSAFDATTSAEPPASLSVSTLKRSVSHREPSTSSLRSSIPRRQSQIAESKTKFGYTMVLEPVDAKPAKAFVVEERHNQFVCTHCGKSFRKESLLTAHTKYNHNSAVTNAIAAASSLQSNRKRSRKTISVCSSDSETVSTAPPTPLASPTPPKEVQGLKKQMSKKQSKIVDVDLEYDAETDEESVDDPSYQTEIVNCKCGFNEEDDLMIQCEYCFCWQHAECFNINPEELPDRYVCFICLDTPGARESCKYMFDQEWLRNGTLPKLSLPTEEDDVVASKMESVVRRSNRELKKAQHQLSSLGSIRKLLESSAKGDMYELALWSPERETNQVSNELNEPTAQENLLLYVDKIQGKMKLDLDSMEAKLSELEEEAGISSAKLDEDMATTSKNLDSLLNDLKKVEKFSYLVGEKFEEPPEIMDIDVTET